MRGPHERDPMYDLLKNKHEGLQGEMVAFAQELLRTHSRSGDESKTADLVVKQMNALGFDQVTTDELADPVLNPVSHSFIEASGIAWDRLSRPPPPEAAGSRADEVQAVRRSDL